MARRGSNLQFDEIGYWSEIKLNILDEYAKPYNTILSSKKLKSVYVDAFAGAGHHISKGTGGRIQGSPVRALQVKPPFDLLHFIDMDEARVEELKRLSAGHPNVKVHHGDANTILLNDVYPEIRWEQYRRGLCILDPYGLDLDWKIILAAGQSKTIEIFLNFPVMDMNRNVLWRDREGANPSQRDRMTRFWGDGSWAQAAYSDWNLFGHPEKTTNEDIVRAFQARLKNEAGFDSVPEPIPMRNSKGATVYYLFFAAHRPLAVDIVQSIFDKYRDKGA